MIALTDGECGSRKRDIEIINKIIHYKIILDSFVVGTSCLGLKTITFASGGYCYCPKSINEGL